MGKYILKGRTFELCLTYVGAHFAGLITFFDFYKQIQKFCLPIQRYWLLMSKLQLVIDIGDDTG